MATKLPSAYGNSFMSQQFSFSSDQISVPDGSLLSNQENILLEQVPTEGLNCRVLSEKFPQQGLPIHINASFLESEGSHQDEGSDAQKTSKFGICQTAGSLDPLEQKINSSCKLSAGSYESTVKHASPVDALASLQSRSWSTPMQSAAGETCSTDTGIQEEWSGLSFQNPEQLIDNQSTNLTSIVKLQDDWVDRNSQNTPRESPLSQRSVQAFAKPCNASPISPESSFRLGPINSQTALPYPFFQSMGNSSSISLSSHTMNDRLKHEVPTHSAAAYQENSTQRISHSSGPELQISGNMPVTQPALAKDVHVGFSKRRTFQCQDTDPQQVASSPKPYKISHMNQSPDSASTNLTTTSGAPHMLLNHKFFRHEYSTQDSCSTSRNPERNNAQLVPVADPKASTNAVQPFTGMSTRNLWENRSIAHLSLDSCGEGSSLCPSMVATSAAGKQVKVPYTLPIDVNYHTFDVSVTKKRKVTVIDMLPWHKEVRHETSRLLGVRDAAVAWAQATGRRSEEVMNEDEIVGELHPLIRAKRRLTCTSKLMQQVFPPAPAAILCSDVGSNLDCVAYFIARLILGDVCSLPGHLSYNTSEVSLDKLQTTNERNAFKFSNVVKCFNNQVEKLQDGLLRMDKSLSFVDNKVEAQELEKLSILNRFAKIYIKSHLNRVDSASSSGTSTSHKTKPQRYVVAVPMPHILPEGIDCLSL